MRHWVAPTQSLFLLDDFLLLVGNSMRPALFPRLIHSNRTTILYVILARELDRSHSSSEITITWFAVLFDHHFMTPRLKSDRLWPRSQGLSPFQTLLFQHALLFSEGHFRTWLYLDFCRLDGIETRSIFVQTCVDLACDHQFCLWVPRDSCQWVVFKESRHLFRFLTFPCLLRRCFGTFKSLLPLLHSFWIFLQPFKLFLKAIVLIDELLLCLSVGVCSYDIDFSRSRHQAAAGRGFEPEIGCELVVEHASLT